ncbi:MAG: hypothetical protein Q9164_002023 [Protoblastenia rupestris]
MGTEKLSKSPVADQEIQQRLSPASNTPQKSPATPTIHHPNDFSPAQTLSHSPLKLKSHLAYPSMLLPSRATLTPPIGQFIINSTLQTAALAAAIAFGIFAVKSVNIAISANETAARQLDEARVANQVAFFVLCMSGNSDTQNQALTTFCSRVLGDAPAIIPAAASALFTTDPTSVPATTSATSSSAQATSSPTNTSTSRTTAPIASTVTADPSWPSDAAQPSTRSASSGSRIGFAVGITFGVLLVATLLGLLYFRRRRARARKRARTESPAYPTETLANETEWVKQARDEDVKVTDGKVKGSSETKVERYSTEADSRKGGRERWGKRAWEWYRIVFLDSTISTHFNPTTGSRNQFTRQAGYKPTYPNQQAKAPERTRAAKLSSIDEWNNQ